MAQTPPSASSPVPLWNGPAPGALGSGPNDIPTLTPYLPSGSSSKPAPAALICPGGGYGALAEVHEGTAYAQWLNQFGIAGFVLKYRLGSHGYHDPIEKEDATRAMRLIRANAALWNIDPSRIAVVGSSAGGHLAATLLTNNDAGDPASADPIERQSSRPDLGVLCYPVITMDSVNTHTGSRRNLLGPDPTPQEVDAASTERHVTSQTAPTFIWCTADDPTVPSINSLLFATALAKAKVAYEIHVYPHGPHGLGLGQDHPPFTRLLPWTNELAGWLTLHGFNAAGAPVAGR